MEGVNQISELVKQHDAEPDWEATITDDFNSDIRSMVPQPPITSLHYTSGVLRDTAISGSIRAGLQPRPK